ncbi:MAG: hypothetical protein AAGC69_07105 [Paracraurococcus sp.]|jgi:hypothetical protein
MTTRRLASGIPAFPSPAPRSAPRPKRRPPRRSFPPVGEWGEMALRLAVAVLAMAGLLQMLGLAELR